MSLEQLCWEALRFPVNGVRLSRPLLLATAEQIRERAPHVVDKPETMNYRTMAPEAGGMFDPKLFGPGTVIDAPPVDPDAPVKPRETQFARIPLAMPIIHPLFVEHVRGALGKAIGRDEYAISHAASSLESGQPIVAALRAHPELSSVVLTELPVIPPELRPLQPKADGRWETAGLNVWYRNVINRNTRLKRYLDIGAPEVLLQTEYHLVQEAIRKLFENDEAPDADLDTDGKPLPSLRSLCGGTFQLYRALHESRPAGEPVRARSHVARLVMFGLGFDVRA